MLSDIKVVLWKEWHQFQKRLKSEVGLFVILLSFGGILAPIGVSRGGLREGIIPSVWFLAVAGIYVLMLYSSFSSESIFSAERANDTLRFLLSTCLSPQAIFLGKWLAMLGASVLLALMVVVLQYATITVYNLTTGTTPNTLSYGIGGGCLILTFASLGSSYTIAGNALLSLVVTNAKQVRQLGMFVMLVPLGGLALCIKLLGVTWDVVVAMAIILVLLTVLSFVGALLAFRSEKVRL